MQIPVHRLDNSRGLPFLSTPDKPGGTNHAHQGVSPTLAPCDTSVPEHTDKCLQALGGQTEPGDFRKHKGGAGLGLNAKTTFRKSC